ncbi:MAG TPA: hypothetical protein VGQ88_10605 [Burkholderiales bacterium]|nr:hypothetical protein [Burkholderiales bacterium]
MIHALREFVALANSPLALMYDAFLDTPVSLVIAAVALLALFALNRSGVARLAPYFFCVKA